jgi:hypothetical protein
MTIFGNRDFGNRDFGLHEPRDAAAEAEHDPEEPSLPEETTDTPTSHAFGIDKRRIVLRVHGGEDIVVGRADGREPAVEIARDMVRHIESASSRGEWPQVDERFVRPGAIVSIDVQRSE